MLRNMIPFVSQLRQHSNIMPVLRVVSARTCCADSNLYDYIYAVLIVRCATAFDDVLQNPAVLRYDPTGLRSAMSATWAEMDKSLEQYRVSKSSTSNTITGTTAATVAASNCDYECHFQHSSVQILCSC
jgi:2-keto-3-deoxy-L-rhamnonate aldolase RhmA